MDQRKAEKLLCGLYVISVVSSLTTSITSGVVWGHWRWTLDQCVGYNCSCILYGESTPTHFHGGSMWTCMWTIFGPIPIILIFISLGLYHGARACFGPSTEATRSVMRKNESGEMIHLQIRTTEMDPINRCYWITASIFSVCFSVYMLSHFLTYLVGYLHSCTQYRRQIIEILNLSGVAVGVVHNRLTCNAIFDFMDYLQPVYNYHIRSNFINTAAALIIGIMASFFATAALTIASYINVKFTRQVEL